MTRTVRRASRDDASAIRVVGLTAWPATYRPLAGDDYVAYGLSIWWSTAAVLRSMQTGRTYVAEEGGQVVGTATAGEKDGACVLWKLYVLPTAQGRGIGSDLLAAVIRDASGDAVLLEYAEGNHRAARFYRDRGFREIRREAAGRFGWPAQVWMRLDVDA
ncbi:GNAT family N-acetyltransferase [Plantactinospora sp. GCM10030261]|uniref:GNAT family N-acetyltransferase n=1 Tax=Plantactinospora sp. GCM10030261 TaxID=3273420 RepID=UPI00361D1556